MAGVLSVAALARLLSRRRHAEPHVPAPDPADELKAKLAASRAPEPVDAPAPTQVTPEPEPLSVDDRRARVHEEGQRAIDEMRGPGK
jgi:hypothetical protein